MRITRKNAGEEEKVQGLRALQSRNPGRHRSNGRTEDRTAELQDRIA